MLSINARARASQAFDEPAFEETLTTDALTWQRGIWDDSSEYYSREIATRFAPIVDGVIARAALSPGLTVLDLGTGTGSVAMCCHARGAGRLCHGRRHQPRNAG
jgi:2-polyprenyl-3-methyl-5-hydroxy-6-metoxy-1,4-benzoquinol methylase